MPIQIPDAGELRDKVRVLEFVRVSPHRCRCAQVSESDTGQKSAQWTWREKRKAWAKVTPTDRTAIFANTGVGGREVELILRRQGLDLTNAIEWKKQFCFLTSVTPLGPGHLLVRAALAEPVECRIDGDKPMCFPAVRAEKYIRHAQEAPMSVNDRALVLVTPKQVTLTPGHLVWVKDEPWEILVPHELDPYKNEYELGRRVEL
ncbi:hypothetical protein [Vermiculatibacterium agrestimuris]|uniref:hypothetical protein n=1 Tax=Vermiculatibacterium agrestimuris TaxID=2941519 RepID=UPI002042566D|nr:hypothetical protein [Vermiculatibacterium agrestimuris]